MNAPNDTSGNDFNAYPANANREPEPHQPNRKIRRQMMKDWRMHFALAKTDGEGVVHAVCGYCSQAWPCLIKREHDAKKQSNS